MKRIIFFILPVIYIASTSSSCRKSIVIQPNSAFPDNIGTWWKYKVYDSNYHLLDTVTIRIIGHTKLDNGEKATIWAIHSLWNGQDTNYVTNKSDGIRILSGKSIYDYVIKRYVFPLEVGDKWITQNINDTNRVTEMGTVSVLAGTFSNGYRIQRNTREPPGLFIIKEDEWFVPDVGMVYRDYGSYGTPGVVSKLWELVSYQIK